MQQAFLKRTLPKLMAFVTVCAALFAFAPRGVDSYEVYLNDKLLLKEYALKEVSLKSLHLDNAKASDRLVIYYTHCHSKTAGTGRSISIKDGQGRILKEWKFADVKDGKKGMIIPVKELLALEKQHAGGQLTMHYAAAELPQGQLLAAL
ncbi:hypothetical protein [Chitinophaga japonensis]|uniref:Uncharacterized protein n=1 Tax=Chitinophaga japonensis TaxID=104662 RepID=A0A562TBQ7_CHIJA|nr:hypothetical protein [Chitinophaga japonensis]TWI91001.1 hypothetical protein LX66_0362 [Chitinophaga japonensis]